LLGRARPAGRAVSPELLLQISRQRAHEIRFIRRPLCAAKQRLLDRPMLTRAAVTQTAISSFRVIGLTVRHHRLRGLGEASAELRASTDLQ
jgi:hypothetical protein